MTEHHLSVRRTARYFTLGPAAATAREVWFVLHGYGQLAARFLRHFAPIDDGARCIVAPEGLSRFYAETGRNDKIGASWMTREDRLTEIDDYIRYLDALYDEVMRGAGAGAGAAVRVTVLGFSQGTATAARWLAQGNARAGRLILWGGEVPPDLDLAVARDRWQKTDVTLVVGSEDPFITPKVLARDEQRLREHGLSFRVERFDGGHEILPDVLGRVVAI
jgi:predicted esterase